MGVPYCDCKPDAEEDGDDETEIQVSDHVSNMEERALGEVGGKVEEKK